MREFQGFLTRSFLLTCVVMSTMLAGGCTGDCFISVHARQECVRQQGIARQNCIQVDRVGNQVNRCTVVPTYCPAPSWPGLTGAASGSNWSTICVQCSVTDGGV